MDERWMLVLLIGGVLILITIVWYSRLPAEPPPAPPPNRQPGVEHFAASAPARRAAPPLDPPPTLRLDQLSVISNYRRQPSEARQNGLMTLLFAYEKLNSEQRAVIRRMAGAFPGAAALHIPEQPLLGLNPAGLSGREKELLAVYDDLPGEGERDGLRRLLLVYDVLDARQREALRHAAIALGPGPYN